MAKTAMSKPEFTSELETLKDDARKIVADLSSLTKTVGDIGIDKSKELTEGITDRAVAELAAMKKRLAELEARSKEYVVVVDKHVKQNPYLYIVGFLGLGLLLGKLVGPKQA